MAKVKSSIDEEPANSFTSMIDIVFLLLIFFILQPFKQPEMKLDSELPKDQGPGGPPQARAAIRLEVHKDPNDDNGAVWIINNKKYHNGDQIEQALLEASDRDLEVPVTIAPWRNVHFMHVLKALDQCYKAKMRQVNWEAPAPSTYKTTGG